MVKKIAITGGIGSGKTYVAEYIKKQGYPVFSCDEIYRELSQSASYIEKVQQLFPGVVSNNQIDKKKLAQIVFSNKIELEKLNHLSHPLIMTTLYEEMGKAQGKVVFAEVPLLFEGGFEKDFHETIFVKRKLSSRIQGIIQRDKISEEDAISRIHNQMDFTQVHKKISEEDLVIHFIENECTFIELEKQVDEILKKLND